MMKKVFSALAVMTLGGSVLAAGVGTASAAPTASGSAHTHKVARSTASAHGKAAPFASVAKPNASVKPNLVKPNANEAAVTKIYNFDNYGALDADTETIRENGTSIALWDDAGADASNQQWSFAYTDTTGLYKLVNNASGRVLDADSDTIGDNGTHVQLWDDLGTDQDNQLWWLVDTGYYDVQTNYELFKWVNADSGRVLDADSDNIENPGTPVQLWDDHGIEGFNQDWELF